MLNFFKKNLAKLYLAINYAWFFVATLNHRVVRKKIQIIKKRGVEAGLGRSDVNSKIFLLASYRINSSLRQEFLKISSHLSLRELSKGNIPIRVVDASNAEYIAVNKNIFSDLNLSHLDFQTSNKKLTTVYRDTLLEAKEKYFCTIFDDQPIIGLTEDALSAGTALLEDFSGLVDIILFENLSACQSEESTQTLVCDLKNLDSVRSGHKPLGVVKYGDYSFAIFRNFHCGFFFNTMIGPCRDYAQRLSWYMKNIDEDSPHKIERAAGRGRGPVYKYIAVPLQTFMLDIDFEHTGPTRAVNHESRNIFEALKRHFNIIYK